MHAVLAVQAMLAVQVLYAVPVLQPTSALPGFRPCQLPPSWHCPTQRLRDRDAVESALSRLLRRLLQEVQGGTPELLRQGREGGLHEASEALTVAAY